MTELIKAERERESILLPKERRTCRLSSPLRKEEVGSREVISL